jgi:LysM repeat protein
MKLLVLMSLLIGLVSCSGSKSSSNLEEVDAGIELTDSNEFTEDMATSDVVADNTDLTMESFDESLTSTEAPVETMGMNNDSLMTDPMMAETAAAPVINEVGGMGEYTVEKNETLMMVAFKIYGDYSKWRQISAQNNGVKMIKEGTVLKYEKPLEMFTWAPEGNKYLIKNGDTLGSISDTSYGTVKHWQDIWNNNKPLIKNPNRIFAGFTIFTPNIEGRDVANNGSEL